MAKSKRAKALDISPKTKVIVFKRDHGACVVCGNTYNVMPNAHYIPRSRGGLGIEQNVVTLCTELTENKCHRRFDFGSREEREEIGEKIRQHLMDCYGSEWNEADLYYKKGV